MDVKQFQSKLWAKAFNMECLWILTHRNITGKQSCSSGGKQVHLRKRGETTTQGIKYPCVNHPFCPQGFHAGTMVSQSITPPWDVIRNKRNIPFRAENNNFPSNLIQRSVWNTFFLDKTERQHCLYKYEWSYL